MNTCRRLVPATLLFLLLSVAVTSAQRSYRGPKTSITISPIHLALPLVEVMGEFMMQPKVGIAGIVGYGSIFGFTAIEIGGQALYYPLGDFDEGMQLGAEILYANVSDDDVQGQSISATSNGLSISPLIGYKVAFGFGLTLDLQGGASYMLVTAHAEDSSGASSAAAAEGFYPMLNINVGWSF